MLAQNFMTATDLGVSEIEHAALQTVLRMLERNEFDQKQQFDMGSWRVEKECGTAACIAGWAFILSGKKAFRFICNGGEMTTSNKALHALFVPFPPPPFCSSEIARAANSKMRAITQDQAAAALRSFLTQGDPRWDEALAAV